MGEERKQTLDDAWGNGYVLAALGFMALEGEDYAGASIYYQESLHLFQRLGDVRSSLSALYQLVVSLTFEDKPIEALTCADEAERIAAQIGEPALVACTLSCKGAVTSYFGNLEEVVLDYRRSLTLYEELGDRNTLPNAHLLLGEILLQLGRVAECHVHLQQALTLTVRSGDTFYQGCARLLSGMASVSCRNRCPGAHSNCQRPSAARHSTFGRRRCGC